MGGIGLAKGHFGLKHLLIKAFIVCELSVGLVVRLLGTEGRNQRGVSDIGSGLLIILKIWCWGFRFGLDMPGCQAGSTFLALLAFSQPLACLDYIPPDHESCPSGPAAAAP